MTTVITDGKVILADNRFTGDFNNRMFSSVPDENKERKNKFSRKNDGLCKLFIPEEELIVDSSLENAQTIKCFSVVGNLNTATDFIESIINIQANKKVSCLRNYIDILNISKFDNFNGATVIFITGDGYVGTIKNNNTKLEFNLLKPTRPLILGTGKEDFTNLEIPVNKTKSLEVYQTVAGILDEFSSLSWSKFTAKTNKLECYITPNDNQLKEAQELIKVSIQNKLDKKLKTIR